MLDSPSSGQLEERRVIEDLDRFAVQAEAARLPSQRRLRFLHGSLLLPVWAFEESCAVARQSPSLSASLHRQDLRDDPFAGYGEDGEGQGKMEAPGAAGAGVEQ